MNDSILSTLAKLAEQRRAKTEELELAVHNLLMRLDRICEVGESATASWATLTRCKIRSNVGVIDRGGTRCSSRHVVRSHH